MKIAILGFGIQGKSTYDYLKDGDHEITILDSNEVSDIPAGVKTVFGEQCINNLDQYDLIFRTPTMHPRDIVKANSEAILSKVTSNTNRFFEDSPTKNIIGVTGTKGKGTTSALITHILKALGKNVYLGGNFGIPPLDLLKNALSAEDWVVLELASFQLIDLKYSPHTAVCLLVEPEHLDWHVDLNEYYESKKQLFKHQNENDIAIYYALNDISKEVASTGSAKLIPYYAEPGAVVSGDAVVIDGKEVIKTSEIKLLGKHNLQNVCAAVTCIWQIDQDIEKIVMALKSFEPLPYRLELIAKTDGISYYDDSFSAAPTAAIAAIEAIKDKKVLILGGKDRGLDLRALAEAVKDNAESIRKVLIIGASGKRLAEELDKVGYSDYEVSELKDMDAIVKRARELARPGDAMVLSPGFPSFDMFTNFEDRGNQFNQAIKDL